MIMKICWKLLIIKIIESEDKMYETTKLEKNNKSKVKNSPHIFQVSDNLSDSSEERNFYQNSVMSKIKDTSSKKMSKEIFNIMVTAAKDAIVMIDNNGKVSFWNKSAEKIFGYSEEEILNKDLHEILTPKLYKEASKKGFAKFRKTGAGAAIGQTLELSAFRKNGEEFPIELSLSAFKSDNEWNSIAVMRDISDRKEKEEKIKQQAAFVKNNPAPVLKSNKEGIILDANPSAKEIYGSEIISKKINTIILSFNENLLVDLKNNHFLQFEDFPNDKTFLFTVREDNNTNAYYFYGTDVTDKKKAIEELKESEEKFKSLVQNSSLGIYRSNEIGDILFANPALLYMLGYKTIEELKEENVAIDLYADPEEREIFQSILGEEGTIFDFKTKLKKKDGTEILVKESSKIVKNNSDKDIIYQGVIQDISKEKKDEVQIKKLYRAIEQSNLSVVITDFKGIIEYVNPKFEEVTGYTSAEAIGINPRILKSGKQNSKFYEDLWDTVKSGNIWSGEFHNKKKNGELFWESSTISPVKDDNGTVTNYVAVKEDITLKKEIEEELINAKERAETSDRMKSEFISQMSHEIRTPINIILSFIELMKDDLKEKVSDEEFENLDIMHIAGKRLIRTVESIMNFSEINSGNYDPIFVELDLYEDILKNMYHEYQGFAKEKFLNFTLLNGVMHNPIKADKYSISQIFSHLADNSIKYTEKGNIEISLTSSDGKLGVKISDTGIGISDKFLSNIFEPFTQEDHGYSRKYEGNGIGLALVKKYCDLNNIDIEINSIKNEGTTVQLRFNNSKID